MNITRVCKNGAKFSVLSNKKEDGRYEIYSDNGRGTGFFTMATIDDIKKLITANDRLPDPIELSPELAALGFLRYDA